MTMSWFLWIDGNDYSLFRQQWSTMPNEVQLPHGGWMDRYEYPNRKGVLPQLV